MKRYLIALLFCLFSSIALAQNPTCPTRPFGDSTNACASTAFVQSASFGFVTLTPATPTYTMLCRQSISSLNAGGTMTVTLPATGSISPLVGCNVQIVSEGGNVITLQPNSGQTIGLPNGQSGGGGNITTSINITNNDSLVLSWKSDGVWTVIGTAQPTNPFTFPNAFPGPLPVGTAPPISNGMTYGHQIPWLDENVVFSGAGVWPFQFMPTNPYAIGASGNSIGSSTVGQTFCARFTSASIAGGQQTPCYTAIGGDTTTTIATGFCNAFNANIILHSSITDLPAFCQTVGGAIFNIQWDARLLTVSLSSTGTGTINLVSPQTTLDFVVTILGRNISNYNAQNGDHGQCLQWLQQSSSGVLDALAGQICGTVVTATEGSSLGRMDFQTGITAQPRTILGMSNGAVFFDASNLLPVGGFLGQGKVNFPGASSGGIFLDGAAVAVNSGLYAQGNNVIGGTLAGSFLSLQSTNNGTPSGDYVQVVTNNILREKIWNDGGITVGPATGNSQGAGTINASSGYFINGTGLQVANLVDYGATTWTPLLQGTGTAGSPTYTTQAGSYERIGRLVTARFDIITTALGGTPTGTWQIAGLPIASGNVGGNFGVCTIGLMSGVTFDASYTSMSGYIAPNTSIITLIENGSAQAGQALAVAKFAAATQIIGNCQYHI